MNKFNIGDLVVKNVDDGRNIRAVYGIVLKTLEGGSHRKNQSVFVLWHRGGKDAWVAAPKLIKVAEAKNEKTI